MNSWSLDMPVENAVGAVHRLSAGERSEVALNGGPPTTDPCLDWRIQK